MSYRRPPEQCPKNEGVICLDTSKCESCGWNDEVAAERSIRILAEMGIRVEMK